MSDETSKAAVPLLPRKKSMVQWGCVCLMLSIAMFGLSLATIQEPILAEMDGMSYFSLLSVASSSSPNWLRMLRPLRVSSLGPYKDTEGTPM